MIQDFAVRYGAPMANRIIKARAGSNISIGRSNPYRPTQVFFGYFPSFRLGGR